MLQLTILSGLRRARAGFLTAALIGIHLASPQAKSADQATIATGMQRALGPGYGLTTGMPPGAARPSQAAAAKLAIKAVAAHDDDLEATGVYLTMLSDYAADCEEELRAEDEYGDESELHQEPDDWRDNED